MAARRLAPGPALVLAALATPLGCSAVLGVSALEAGSKGDVALGASCDRSPLCESGHCVDGVCCENDCAGRCERCDGAGANGACRRFTAGTNPGGECPAG